MKLERVTFTGADDSLDPALGVGMLASLSLGFPWVEWGVLFSPTRVGTPRYPTAEWVQHLADHQRKSLAAGRGLQLAAHVCGQWGVQMVEGMDPLGLAPGGQLAGVFGRVQLNLSAGTVEAAVRTHPHGFLDLLRQLHPVPIILQAPRAVPLFEIAYDAGHNVQLLFDASGGEGITPPEWPSAAWLTAVHANAFVGYAGGLGPHNVRKELPRIAEAAGDARTWIDMERHVRGDDETAFSVSRVRHVIDLVRPHVVAGAGRTA